jgi:hypothetical protein
MYGRPCVQSEWRAPAGHCHNAAAGVRAVEGNKIEALDVLLRVQSLAKIFPEHARASILAKGGGANMPSLCVQQQGPTFTC